MSVRRQRNRAQNVVKWQSVGRQTAVNRRLRGCKCQSDDSEIALKTPSNGSQSAVKWQSIGAYGAANVSQTTAKSRSKSNGSQSDAVNRRLRGCKCHQMTALKTSSNGSQSAVKRQSIGAYGAANVSQTDSEIALKTSSNGSQSAVKRQSIGAYGAANVSQMTAKSRSKRRHMAVSRQSNGSQSALTGLQMSVRRQRNRAQNAVKRQSVGSQSAGAYGAANQTAAKSCSKVRCQSAAAVNQALKTPSNGSQSAVKWQSIGAYGAANVSQMTAKSRSKRRHMAVSRQSNGSQSALTGVQMSVR